MRQLLWIKKQIKKEKKLLLISFFCGIFITVTAGFYTTKMFSETIQNDIANRVVRFHVLANSDTQKDQQLKLCVRDAVLDYMKPYMQDCNSIEQSKEVLAKSLDRIKETALKEIEINGFEYDVSVFLSNDLFPTKNYGSITFPAGMYDALRIEIGEAKGRNWWCVMFPPMCFVDAACDDVSDESKEKLKNVLTQEEYEMIAYEENELLTPKVKFKIVEWWQEKKAENKQYATRK